MSLFRTHSPTAVHIVRVQVPGLALTRLAIIAAIALSSQTATAKQTASAIVKAPLEMKMPAVKAPSPRYSGWPSEEWNEYSTLAKLVPFPIGEVQKLDGPIRGDPAKGKALVFDRSRGGSCLACHIVPGGTLPGNVGPDLSSVGGGARPDEYLYNYVYDARVYNKTTVMPPWGAHKVFTKDEIQDIVAYLKTLTKPTAFKSPEDDPSKRSVPQETRDNLDPTENPAMFTLDSGKALFETAGPRGKSCASCHPKPAQSFKTWAAGMPKYDARMKKILGVEEFVTRHARATAGADFPMESDQNLALTIYLHSLSNGEPIQVKLDHPATKAAAKRGEELMHRKIGQLNFACLDCHEQAQGKWIRGQYLGGITGQADHFPTYRTSRSQIWDLRKRFQWCNVSVRANDLPADAPQYGDLELYLTSLSNGKKCSIPGIRH
jgi:L-cysteine S-thiosulfotransferase